MRTAEQILRSIIANVDAMRTEAPFDVRNDAPDNADHWFGGFEETGLDDFEDEPKFRWPNLGVLIEEAEKVLNNEKKKKNRTA